MFSGVMSLLDRLIDGSGCGKCSENTSIASHSTYCKISWIRAWAVFSWSLFPVKGNNVKIQRHFRELYASSFVATVWRRPFSCFSMTALSTKKSAWFDGVGVKELKGVFPSH